MQARGRFPLGMAEARWPLSAHRGFFPACIHAPCPSPCEYQSRASGWMHFPGQSNGDRHRGGTGRQPKCLRDFWTEGQNAPSHLGSLGSGQLQAGSDLPAATLAGPKGRRQANQKTRTRSDQTSVALAMAKRGYRGAPGGCSESWVGAPQWRLRLVVRGDAALACPPPAATSAHTALPESPSPLGITEAILASPGAHAPSKHRACRSQSHLSKAIFPEIRSLH